MMDRTKDLAYYVDAVRRRAPAVVGALVAAAALTLGLILLQPQRYRATADVVVPIASPGGSAIAAVGQSVSDFEGAVRSDVVAKRVSSETGVPQQQVADRIDTEQLFGGTVVEVTYTADDAFVAEDAVGVVSREALVLLLQARLAPFEQELALAERDANAAANAYQDFLIANELVEPEQFFRDQQARLRVLRDRADGLRAEGNDERADEIDALIQSRTELLAPIQVEYLTTREDRARAGVRLGQARASFGAAQAAVKAAEEQRGSVTVSNAVPVSKTAQLFRQLLIAVVVAAVLAIGVIVLLELIPPASDGVPSSAEATAPLPERSRV